MTNDNPFNELLDHALSEYRDAEPLAGMEDRVLKRLQSQSAERHWAWWMWGAVATFAALVLVGVWIGISNRTRPSSSTQPTQAREQTAPPSGTTTSPSLQSHGVAIQSATQRASVKPTELKNAATVIARAETPIQSGTMASQFPTPAPLTAEEHALLAMLHANPDALPKPRENSDDTTIAPLEIKPLAGSAAPTEENSNE